MHLFSFFRGSRSKQAKQRRHSGRFRPRRNLSAFRAEMLEERVVFSASPLLDGSLADSALASNSPNSTFAVCSALTQPIATTQNTAPAPANLASLLAAAATNKIDPVFAPDTDPTVVDSYDTIDSHTNTPIAEFNFSDSSRWSSTSTNTGYLAQGDATTITWSVVPDGTAISGFNGEASAPSNLRSFLAGIYGNNATSSKPEDQPWFPVLKSTFDRWSALTGITYVYQAADDGAALGGSNPGVAGVRGDVRLSGHTIDGNSNVLAYTFYPTVGDMVIDTGDNFYANTANNSLRLRNTVAHELGHAIGLGHVQPVNGTKLMEPYISLNYDGPQEDDILAASRGYGDPLEKNGGNDTAAKASPLAVANNAFAVSGVSIDDVSDTDWYSVTVGGATTLNVTLDPTGTTYQTDSGSFNAKAQSDLALAIYGSGGSTLIASANLTGAGSDEVLNNVNLASAGTYYLKVTGAASAAQMYQLTGNVTSSVPAPEITVLEGTTSIADGATINFGATAPGTPVSQTFTIRNDGTQALTLAPINAASMPAGFTLTSNIPVASLAPGATTTFTIRLDAAQIGAYGGAISFGNNDSDENPFDLVLSGSVSSQLLAIDAGGGAAGSFAADNSYSGGGSYSTGATIDTSGVTNPAGQAVYQTERYGNFSYTLAGLAPGAAYTLRLHFAEIYWSSALQRLFNVEVNGTRLLTNYDIFAAAGGKNKAVVVPLAVTADSTGTIQVTFVSVRDNAKLSGLELLAGSTTPPTNNPPTVAAAAAANPNPVTGTTAALGVLGADADSGESSLSYQWSVVSVPAGAAAPTFSANGSNAAKNVTATFSKAGNYTFRATITDPSGASVASDVSLTVNQTATTINVGPSAASVANGLTQQFTASALDQFGAALTTPAIAWSVDAGGLGTVNGSGLYTAPATGAGAATVRATSGSVSGTAAVTVTAVSSQVLAIDAGGGTVGSFQADQYASGGTPYSTGAMIDTSGVTNPAGQAVYQSERYGNFAYSLPGLTPGGAYTLRLHFAEIYWNAPGQRLFNVQVNGTPVLTNYDIWSAAGGINRAVAVPLNVTADASGTIKVTFLSVRDNAKVSGLELLSAGGVTPNSPPTVAVAAAATSSLVTGATTGVSVLGADADTGESSLSYRWSVVNAPSGAAAPTFSANGTNAAKNATATFYQAGSYTLRATITDPSGAAVNSDVSLTVSQTATSLTVAPGAATVAPGGARQFTASVLDQFGGTMSAAGVAWSVDAGGVGSVSASGLYTAPASGTGNATIRATSGSLSATASVTVSGLSSQVAAIDAGGGAVGSFSADKNFAGGIAYSTGAAIDTSGVANAAPASLYQTERYGNFSYTLPGLTAGATYTVRLHFAEIYWNAPGRRLFNVQANGTQVLTNYDIYSAAGGINRAVVVPLSVTADASGKIALNFISVRDNAKLSGLEVLTGGAGTGLQATAPTATDQAIASLTGGMSPVSTGGQPAAMPMFAGKTIAPPSAAAQQLNDWLIEMLASDVAWRKAK